MMKTVLHILGLFVFLVIYVSSCRPLPNISIKYFQISPSEITQGSLATLRWSVIGSTSVSIDNGVGKVSNEGVVFVKPSATTTYLITATNADMIVQDNVTVVVKSQASSSEVSQPSLSTPTKPSIIPNMARASVTKVVDGDTIYVKYDGKEYKVRYIGIDTPETVHPFKPVQYFGKEASSKNRELVADKTVILEKDISEKDKYGRLLRYIWVDNTTMVNAELVRLGYAVSYSYPPDVKYQDVFLKLEKEARENGRGLWAQQ